MADVSEQVGEPTPKLAPKPAPKVEKYIRCYSPLFGMDPELFFTKGDQVIGAERVIPDGVLAAPGLSGRGCIHTPGMNKKAFILDGVQVELNPNPHGCRANLADELSIAFKTLKKHLDTIGGVNVSFRSIVTIDKKELDSLSESARQFGCEPSFNLYDKDAKIACNPATYLKRSAGGHIHLGLLGHGKAGSMRSPDYPELFQERKRLVPLLDVLLGNTCVMLDRDPEAAERRKNYGRAGEYRLPKYGIEYRTLSNFWLRAYPLTSFVLGLSRLATSILGTTLNYWDAEKALLDRIDMKAIQTAINTNDLALAIENWKLVRPFIHEHVTQTLDDGCGLERANLTAFDKFLDRVHEKGLDAWFPTDPLTHWCNMNRAHGTGWESFLAGVTYAP